MQSSKRYAKLDKIGSGSFGVAWIARTTESHPEGSGKICVLKLPNPKNEEEGKE